MSLASAITQTADLHDALRTDRPHRKGLDRDLLAAFFEDVVPRTSAAG